jgi:hypothetical protein
MSQKPTTVLAPAAPDYVLPAPARAAGEVLVVAPRRDAEFGWRRGAESAQQLGRRFGMQVENVQLLLGELRERIQELDTSIAEASRAQLKGAVRDLLAVLDWADVAQTDLRHETTLAAAGVEPIDVSSLCQEVAARVAVPEQPIYVTGAAQGPWWGNAADLAALVREALALVGERTQGVGARSLDVQEDQGVVRLAIRSAGDPADGIEAGSVASFRRAADRVGALVLPDALGIGGSGMALELPQALSQG